MKRKLKAGLGVVAGLALVVTISGFALTRGYLMHFVVNGETISRTAYYQLSEDMETNGGSMYCAPQWTLGFVYLFEVVCFDTQDEVNAYMSVRDGR